ncbi:MAG: hypothetical protein HC897_18550, partial [Thermoanaerobaculia bacterium]|nr:hypothetical protein [Thermoanaerobaculia bacterium]
MPEGGAQRGLRALLTEVERVDQHGFSESELARAKQELDRGFEQIYRERDKLDSAGFRRRVRAEFSRGRGVSRRRRRARLI